MHAVQIGANSWVIKLKFTLGKKSKHRLKFRLHHRNTLLSDAERDDGEKKKKRRRKSDPIPNGESVAHFHRNLSSPVLVLRGSVFFDNASWMNEVNNVMMIIP